MNTVNVATITRNHPVRPRRERFPVRGFTPTIRQASAFEMPRAINRVNNSRFTVCGARPGRP
jgi:hypothetical protein